MAVAGATVTLAAAGRAFEVIVGLVLLPFVLDLVAALLNRSWLSNPIPAELAGLYDEEAYATSQRYNCEKLTLGFLQDTFELVVFFAFWFLGGFPLLDGLVMQLDIGPLLTGATYIIALGLASQLLGLPFSIYSTFVLEARYGFNRSTLVTFVKDLVKTGMIALVLGMPLLVVLLGFFTYCSMYAWLYAWIVLTIFMAALVLVSPILLLPLFLEMIPLPEGLAIAIDGLDKDGPWIFLKRIYYEVDGVHNGAKAYETGDLQYAGKHRGAKLSLWRGSDGLWKISEGGPGGPGAVYASSLEPAASPEAAPWRLHRLADGCQEAAANGPKQQQLLPPEEAAQELQLVRHDVGALRRELLALAGRLEYTCDKIFIIDGSTRSEHSNAFCTGFGSFRRICLFDTLLLQLTPDEIVAVLAHEIGHDKLHHQKIRLVQTLVLLFLEFFLLGQFISSPTLAKVFLLSEPKVYTGFTIFSIVWGTVEGFLSIPMKVQSRSQERQADCYSVDAHESHAEWLASALKKMMRNSKSNLTPHPLKVFLDYSHPPLLTRTAQIRRYHQERWGDRRSH